MSTIAGIQTNWFAKLTETGQRREGGSFIAFFTFFSVFREKGGIQF